MKIDRTEIVREALALLNEVGLDKLSTRALATRLGVQQPALYWHFKDKRALMDAMNAEMMRVSHTYRIAGDGDDWRLYLRKTSESFRRALLAYRDGARIHAGSRAEASDLDVGESQLRFLIAHGFEDKAALGILITLSRFTVGFVLEEQAEMEHPPSTALQDPAKHPLLTAALERYIGLSQDQLFRDGVDAIIAGVEQPKDARTGP